PDETPKSEAPAAEVEKPQVSTDEVGKRVESKQPPEEAAPTSAAVTELMISRLNKLKASGLYDESVLTSVGMARALLSSGATPGSMERLDGALDSYKKQASDRDALLAAAVVDKEDGVQPDETPKSEAPAAEVEKPQVSTDEVGKRVESKQPPEEAAPTSAAVTELMISRLNKLKASGLYDESVLTSVGMARALLSSGATPGSMERLDGALDSYKKQASMLTVIGQENKVTEQQRWKDLVDQINFLCSVYPSDSLSPMPLVHGLHKLVDARPMFLQELRPGIRSLASGVQLCHSSFLVKGVLQQLRIARSAELIQFLVSPLRQTMVELMRCKFWSWISERHTAEVAQISYWIEIASNSENQLSSCRNVNLSEFFNSIHRQLEILHSRRSYWHGLQISMVSMNKFLVTDFSAELSNCLAMLNKYALLNSDMVRFELSMKTAMGHISEATDYYCEAIQCSLLRIPLKKLRYEFLTESTRSFLYQAPRLLLTEGSTWKKFLSIFLHAEKGLQHQLTKGQSAPVGRQALGRFKRLLHIYTKTLITLETTYFRPDYGKYNKKQQTHSQKCYHSETKSQTQ
ncbi:hypothetical protein BOX15_Mlig011518g2, partial [Macrostomum lignano]